MTGKIDLGNQASLYPPELLEPIIRLCQDKANDAAEEDHIFEMKDWLAAEARLFPISAARQ